MLELLAESPAVFIAIAFAFALLIGSFLNVVIYRLPIMMEREWRAQCAELAETAAPELPEGRFNLVVPRSRCPECGHPITALQNIPVISYLALGALGRLGVGVGETRLVRRNPRVGKGIAGLLSRLELGPVRRHADVSSRFTVALRAPIQAAAAMSTPRPITQTHRPSLTGPMRPMPRPPGLGSLSMLSR